MAADDVAALPTVLQVEFAERCRDDVACGLMTAIMGRLLAADLDPTAALATLPDEVAERLRSVADLVLALIKRVAEDTAAQVVAAPERPVGIRIDALHFGVETGAETRQ